MGRKNRGTTQISDIPIVSNQVIPRNNSKTLWDCRGVNASQ